MRGHRDLRVLTALAPACGLLAWLIPVGSISLLIALPLVFFLPGYAIAAAAFARRQVERTTLLVLGVGLSLAVLTLGALVLNFTPGGIRAGSWVLLLVLVVLGACRLAAIRRARAASPARAPSLPSASFAAISVIAAAILIAGAAVTLAFTPLPAKHAVGYTALWIKPLGSTEKGGAQVGVRSEEQHSVAYRLRVRFAQAPPQVRHLRLSPGEARLLHFASNAVGSVGAAQPVAAILYRAADPQHPYRRVSAWIQPPEGTG